MPDRDEPERLDMSMDAIRARRLERLAGKQENERTALDRNVLTSYTAAGVLTITTAEDRQPRCAPCVVSAYRGRQIPSEGVELAASSEHGTVKLTLVTSDLKALIRLVQGKPVRPEKMADLGVALMDLDAFEREENG